MERDRAVAEQALCLSTSALVRGRLAAYAATWGDRGLAAGLRALPCPSDRTRLPVYLTHAICLVACVQGAHQLQDALGSLYIAAMFLCYAKEQDFEEHLDHAAAIVAAIERWLASVECEVPRVT